MKRTFLVHHIPAFKDWETCFLSLIEKSDTFRIIFQGTSDPFDADDFLNAGKLEFLNIPSITISPYKGMENSIEVTGELNIVARELFQTFSALRRLAMVARRIPVVAASQCPHQRQGHHPLPLGHTMSPPPPRTRGKAARTLSRSSRQR